MIYETKTDAVRAMVDDFNQFPTTMIQELIDFSDGNEWKDLNPEHNYRWIDIPGWGTMFQARDVVAKRWIEEHVETMLELGFTMLESEKYGIFFGINAGGFNFYDAYWTPLYDAMGLKWHEQ